MIEFGPAFNAITESIAFATTEEESVPPDPAIAVSSLWIIVVVNSYIRVFERDMFILKGEARLRDFFTGDVNFPFDPKIIYDPHSDRFVVVAVEEPGVMIAYSGAAGMKDGSGILPLVDPGSPWSQVNFPLDYSSKVVCEDAPTGPPDIFADQPHLGFDAGVWLVGAPLVGQLGNVGNSGVLAVMPKPTPINPTPQPVVFLASKFVGPGGVLGCFPKELDGKFARGFDAPNPVTNWPAIPMLQPVHYFVGVGAKAFAACDPLKVDMLRLYAIRNAFGESPILEYYELQTDECFDAISLVNVGTVAGAAPTTLDGRITSAYLMASPKGPVIVAAHNVNVRVDIPPKDVDRVVVRWYRIRTNNWPVAPGAQPMIEDSGELSVSDARQPVHLHLPSICVDPAGDIAVVMERSSRLERQSIQVTGMRPGDMQMLPPTEVKESLTDGAPYFLARPGSSRWGDYTGLTPDPADPSGRTFWGISEFGMPPVGVPDLKGLDTYRWGTWAFQFSFTG